MIRRLLLAGVTVWIARWAAMEIAMQIARRRPPPETAPKDSQWPPGRMPSPFD